MNRRNYILSLLIMLICMMNAVVANAEKSLSLSLPKNANVVQGQSFNVILMATDFPSFSDPEEYLMQQKYTGCVLQSVTPGSTYQSSTIIGGKHTVTSSRQYILTFMASKKGQYNIGPIVFDGVESNQLSGKIMHAKEIEKQHKEQVKKSEKANNKNSRATFKLICYVSKDEAQVGEPLLYELRLLCDHPEVFSSTSCTVVKEPSFEGFDVRGNRIYGTQQGEMTYKGKAYAYVVLDSRIITPLKEKTLTVNGGEYEVTVVPIYITGDGFFGPMYQRDLSNSYQVKLKPKSVKVKVKGYAKPDNKRMQTTPVTPRETTPDGPVYDI